MWPFMANEPFGKRDLFAGYFGLRLGVLHQDVSKCTDENGCNPLDKTVVNVKYPKNQEGTERAKVGLGAFCLFSIYTLCTYLALRMDKFKVRRRDIDRDND